MLPIMINSVALPEWVADLETFRRWANSSEFPEQGLIAFLAGKLWIGDEMETFQHNQAKDAVLAGIRQTCVGDRGGRLIPDRMRVTHPEANVSTEPDGCYVSRESLHRQIVQISQGPTACELVGAPDLILEVVSDSSVTKDTVVLPKLYWKAGVKEYWLVDPRTPEPQLEIFTPGERGYVRVKPRKGWLKSAVLGQLVRLVKEVDEFNLPVYRLELK